MERWSISALLDERRAFPASKKPEPYGARSVIYVMSRDQRVVDNHGLATAQHYALEYRLPLIVTFCFVPGLGYRAREHFDYMVHGLREVATSLGNSNIPFVPLFGKHYEAIMDFAKIASPAVVVTDFSPLRGSRSWQAKLAQRLPIIVVDSHNCVPAWLASQKQEFSARTLRPKIHALLNDYIVPQQWLPMRHPHIWSSQPLSSLDSTTKLLGDLRSRYASNNTHIAFKPGEMAAQLHLKKFIQHRLKGYSTRRNDPTVDGLSGLSPYLHFGTIGAMTVVRKLQLAAETTDSLQSDIHSLIEELVIRKELSDNFCYYNNKYDSLLSAPDWAQKTLAKHAIDEREYIYSREQFEQAATHDVAWNAAQMQLLITGKMHGYMRMYWAKKILEWSESPEVALATVLYLNDFYSIDGGDPNGYVGALWSIAGLHDRPWGERSVYGTVRSMVYNGLKRKFNIEKYTKNNEI